MTTLTTKRLMTAEEFHDWANRPENQDKQYELDRGEVVEVTRPAEFHGVLCAWIAHLLWSYALQRGRGCVCSNDTGLLVERDPDTLRGPDVMFIDEPLALEQLSRKFTQRIPKLVIEVMSPNDRNATVYRPGKEEKVVAEGEELTGEDVLPDLRVSVTELFALPGQ